MKMNSQKAPRLGVFRATVFAVSLAALAVADEPPQNGPTLADPAAEENSFTAPDAPLVIAEDSVDLVTPDEPSTTLDDSAPAESTTEVESIISEKRLPADLSDEETRLLRRWITELARREDRRLHQASMQEENGENPFQDENGNDAAPAPPKNGNGENGAAANSNAQNNNQQRPQFDPAVVSAGQSAFQAACTSCHDAERSTSRRKSLGGWIATVRRMAAKDGADVSPGDVQPIATYLASLNPAGSDAEAGGNGAASDTGAAWSLFSTVSLIHRSGVREELENEGFFPEIWLGAEWHPEGPLSARVHVCVTCHTEASSVSSRIEIAEGFFRFDIDKWACCEGSESPIQSHIDAGRFIVPFGAFASTSHPAAFNTATRPLMYNMGQKLYRDELPSPLLPMPYADEGLLASVTLPVACETNATFDFYAVNGLQGDTSVDLGAWWQSRDYVDNNTEPAVGGRATIGNKSLKAGASLMTGRFNDNSQFAAVPELLDYKIYGADLVWRWEDRVRITAEYARRDSDAFDFIGGFVDREVIKGTILEGEVKLWDKPRISAVLRYDDQRRTDGPLLLGSPVVTPDMAVRRFTYGLNFALGASTLMINHERWNVPDPLNDLDVLAIRWVAAF